MDVVTIQVMYGIVGAIIGVIGALTVSKRTSKEEGSTAGTIASDLGYLKKGIDDISHKLERLEERYYLLSERVATVEASTKQAHKRIDRIEAGPDSTQQ